MRNNIMADRLNKLCESLNNEDYENAMHLHKASTSTAATLDDCQQVRLAKAYFFIANDYIQAIQILQRTKDSKSIEVFYEARMLLVKASYLCGYNPQEYFRHLEELRTTISKLSEASHYLACISEVKRLVQTPPRGSQIARNNSGEDERRQFQRILREQDDNSIIMEGMPKFLIPSAWYEAWREYTSTEKIQRERKHPGPITQFELVDHLYRVVFDPLPGKDYTNKYIFNGSRYEILPKKCWQFLLKRYDGTELKRFNISFIDKPYEIMTEVYLKKIQIARSQRNKFFFVQITKKQAWSGLKTKLAPIWGAGDIFQFDQKRGSVAINEAEILQEVDTMGKRYIYVDVAPDKKRAQGQRISAEKCGNKGCGQTQKLMYCKCKSIKYCGMDCLKADFKNHKKKCELEMAHSKQQSVILKNFNLEEKDFAGMKGRVGLKNLGNTCYMNSGLQCLSNTKEMTEYFMKDEFKNHINYSNPLGTKGNLACTYAELIREMWTGSSQSVSPFKLKKIIGNFATQFSGFGQQDSQEFISYLIDGLSEDLNLVKKKEAFETGEEIKSDEQMSRESEVNYSKRIQSYVRNLMVGQFKSTVVCLTCKKVSVCFDPYLLISLPIPANEEWQFYFVPTELSRGAIKFPFEYNRSTTLEKISNELVARYNKKLDAERERDSMGKGKEKLSTDRLLYLHLDGDKFQILRVFEGNERVSSIRGKFLLFCLQLPATKDEETFIAQFFYNDERISFPRFIKLPRKSNSSVKESVIFQALQRGVESEKRQSTPSQLNFSDTVMGEKVIDSKPYRKMEIYCRKKLKLLTYVDCGKEGISRFMEPSEEALLTLDECLNNFGQEESLVGDNLWYCNKCKEHKEAKRHLELYKSSKILVIAFKRFNRFRKIKTPIKFPLENFNMGPYLLSNKNDSPVFYDLYSVVNHYGTMGGGHYTSYSQNFLNKKWYEFNDSRVSQISRSDVVSGDSYVLFFRRKD